MARAGESIRAIARPSEESHGTWTFTTDHTIEISPAMMDSYNPEQHFRAVGIELRSPVMDLARDEWTTRIRTIVNKLKEAIDGDCSPNQPTRLVLSQKCAMHVHLSDGPEVRASFEACKKVLMLQLGFERQLDEALTVSRMWGNKWCRPLSNCWYDYEIVAGFPPEFQALSLTAEDKMPDWDPLDAVRFLWGFGPDEIDNLWISQSNI
ncbi:hypothetical protein BDY21DRAFT_420167, partial [Lineolata rhizophorae]